MEVCLAMNTSSKSLASLVSNRTMGGGEASKKSLNPRIATAAAGGSSSKKISSGKVRPSTKKTKNVVKNILSTDKNAKKIKKTRGNKISNLVAVVRMNGRHMTGPQISASLGLSRSKGYRLKIKADRFIEARVVPARLPRIRKQKDVIDVVTSISAQLCSFPHQSIVAEFEANGIADIRESRMEDRIESAKKRQQRADKMWSTYDKGFYCSREPLNTVICILYESSHVTGLLSAIKNENYEYLSNILVVKMARIFVLVMTDIRSAKKCPCEWLLQSGDFSSAFMWVNIKDAFWVRHIGSFDTLPADVAPSVDSKKRKTSATRPFPKTIVWNKVSDCTIAGVNLLCYMWKRVEQMLAAVETVPGTSVRISSSSNIHIHVKPYSEISVSKKTVSTNKAAVEKEVDTKLIGNIGVRHCESWYEQVEQFLEKTTNDKRVAKSDVAVKALKNVLSKAVRVKEMDRNDPISVVPSNVEPVIVASFVSLIPSSDAVDCIEVLRGGSVGVTYESSNMVVCANELIDNVSVIQSDMDKYLNGDHVKPVEKLHVLEPLYNNPIMGFGPVRDEYGDIIDETFGETALLFGDEDNEYGMGLGSEGIISPASDTVDSGFYNSHCGNSSHSTMEKTPTSQYTTGSLSQGASGYHVSFKGPPAKPT